MFKANRKKQRPYSIKKTGIKDEFIDRQILAIHKAIVDKLLQNPTMIPPIKALLHQRREQGEIGHGEYITWLSLLELFDEPELFKNGVLEYSGKMRKLRRRTPLVNVLTEEERLQALSHDATGTTANIDFLIL